MAYSSTGYQGYGYDSNYMKARVMELLSQGLIFAVIISALMIFLPLGLQILLAIPAGIAEIIAIIGYFFAKNEGTIEKLYYTFVVSSAVLLGFSLTFYLSSSSGAFIVGGALGATALIVGGIFTYVERNQPDVAKYGRRLFFFGIVFIILSFAMLIFFPSYIGFLLMSFFGAILFSFYLLFDYGRLMRGQYSSPARMAWNLYWDILLIFKYILEFIYLMSNSNN